MDDLISRQAAIDAITQYLGRIKRDFKQWEGTARIILDHVPSAQPGWIPTSVRLPEDNEEVLFCDNEGERWLGWHYGFWKTERLDFDEDDVVAWMPLPKPWEGEKP